MEHGDLHERRGPRARAEPPPGPRRRHDCDDARLHGGVRGASTCSPSIAWRSSPRTASGPTWPRCCSGRWGSRSCPSRILGSTFGCANGLILSGARVLFAMARDGVFFDTAGRIDPRRQTPRGALVLQGVWSIVLALSGTYDRLLTYVTFSSLAFNALTVVALLVLRRTRPSAARPYRTWGYPVTPALYLAGALFFLIYLRRRPPRCLCGGGARRAGVARLCGICATLEPPPDVVARHRESPCRRARERDSVFPA